MTENWETTGSFFGEHRNKPVIVRDLREKKKKKKARILSTSFSLLFATSAVEQIRKNQSLKGKTCLVQKWKID